MGGVNITPRHNVVSESITNLFMVLRPDVFKTWILTSEPDEHGFGNMRRVQNNFTCLMLVCLIEKEMCRTEQMFRGKLRPKRAKGCGYFEYYEEWVNISKTNYKYLESFHLEIDIQEGAATVIDQLWPTRSKIMIIASDRMKPFLDLAGVLVTHLSPFCRYFETPKDLLQAYIAHSPRKFNHGPISGTKRRSW